MLIIVKDGELTERKKQETYRYRGLFKVIQRITKLIEELEVVQEYLTYSDEENIRKQRVKQFNRILDEIEEQIQYAKEEYQAELPVCQGGDISRIIRE